MNIIASHMLFRLPSFSPTKKATIHPLKAPYIMSVEDVLPSGWKQYQVVYRNDDTFE